MTTSQSDRIYIAYAEALAIHADQIARFGGSSGLRDSGLLEAALYRPQSGYYADIYEEAAALWESLSQNHPFVDGNKRVALASTATFLVVNGIRIKAKDDVIIAFLSERYATGTMNFQTLLDWLRANTEPL
jgi:death-on-curing protein